MEFFIVLLNKRLHLDHSLVFLFLCRVEYKFGFFGSLDAVSFDLFRLMLDFQVVAECVYPVMICSLGNSHL